jgi:hypothetical protein
MIPLRIFGCALLLMALTAPSVRADDICGGDQERARATAEARAAIAKAEKAGNQPELFLAYQSAAADDCLANDLINKSRTSMVKVGRDLAAKAESKGVLYSSESIAVRAGEERRANQGASAFAWLEAIGEYPEANRVMLKAVQAKSDDLALFKAAWGVDQSRYGPRDPKTGDRQPYVSPPAYRQTLERTASANADRLMKAEEKDASGLTGNLAELGTASMRSLEKLRLAALWMKFLPGGDKPARDRAEQRGDTIMTRSDPTFSQGSASGYYDFAGTPRAKDKIGQIEKKSQESQRAMEKASEKLKDSFTQKSEADQKKFEKKKADLEKELGF